MSCSVAENDRVAWQLNQWRWQLGVDSIDMWCTYVGIDVCRFTYQLLGKLFECAIYCPLPGKMLKDLIAPLGRTIPKNTVEGSRCCLYRKFEFNLPCPTIYTVKDHACMKLRDFSAHVYRCSVNLKLNSRIPLEWHPLLQITSTMEYMDVNWWNISQIRRGSIWF